jgi:ferritin-like metal-binding protein YciE
MALSEVLLDELRDMYSAENQLVVALPKLAKGAKGKHLKDFFAAHLVEDVMRPSSAVHNELNARK